MMLPSKYQLKKDQKERLILSVIFLAVGLLIIYGINRAENNNTDHTWNSFSQSITRGSFELLLLAILGSVIAGWAVWFAAKRLWIYSVLATAFGLALALYLAIHLWN